MFSSVGWGEILVLVIVGIIVVGPERLPRIINDVKAMIHAARNAISSARSELGDDFREDFEDFRKPLQQIGEVRRMGARGLVSKALLDDDPDFLRDLESSARGVTGAVTGRGAQTAPATPTERPTTADTSASADRPTPAEKKNSDGGSDGGNATPDWGTLDDGDVL